MERTWQVRPGRREDAQAAATALAAAFHDTEVFRWIVPDEAQRAHLLPPMFLGYTRHVHPFTGNPLVATEGSRVRAAALWAPPGQWRAPLWRTVLMMLTVLRTPGRKGMQQFGDRGQPVDQALIAAHPTEPHWYLSVLGVDPSAAGTGAGGALVRAGLDRARETGHPAYLECEEHLVGYDERFGFQSRGPIRMPKGAPVQFGLWAEPRS
jgi:GNAT superfamily N-acetyltransferase